MNVELETSSFQQLFPPEPNKFIATTATAEIEDDDENELNYYSIDLLKPPQMTEQPFQEQGRDQL